MATVQDICSCSRSGISKDVVDGCMEVESWVRGRHWQKHGECRFPVGKLVCVLCEETCEVCPESPAFALVDYDRQEHVNTVRHGGLMCTYCSETKVAMDDCNRVTMVCVRPCWVPVCTARRKLAIALRCGGISCREADDIVTGQSG